MRYRQLLSIIALLTITGSIAHCSPAKLYVVPQDVGLVVGAQQQFQVICEDEDGIEITPPAPITWSVSSGAGSITATGLFTAGSTPGKYLAAVTVSIAGGMSAKANAEVYKSEQHGGYLLERSIGSLDAGKFNSPLDIAFDSAGNFYAINGQERCVNKFDSSGLCISQIALSFPPTSSTRIAVDSSGNVYALDVSNSRVEKYLPSGGMLQWGSAGTGDGQFTNPCDIAVDSTGLIYVLDTAYGRIQVFNADGSFIRKWYYNLSADYAAYPKSITIGLADTIYVMAPDAWIYDAVVQRFTNRGTLLKQLSLRGIGDIPTDFAVDSAQNLYFVVGTQIVKLDSTGNNVLSQWGNYGFGSGDFMQIAGFTVNLSGTVYVSDYKKQQIQSFNSSGNLLSTWSSSGNQKGQFKYPSSLALDNAGNLYVADVGNDRIQKFDANGTFLQTLCSKEQGDSVFACPGGITVDSSNNLYLTNLLNGNFVSYNSSGSLLGNYSQTVDPKWVSPLGLVRSRVSPYDFFITDAQDNSVSTINAQGNFRSEWASAGNADAQVMSPAGITVNSQNLEIIADYGNNQVQVHNGGIYAWKFGAAGTGNGQFQGPAGVCVDSGNNIYVVDNGNCRVQKFSPAGVYTSKLGSKGYGQFQFMYPECVVVSANNAMYVSDTYNHRILRFIPAPPVSDIKSAKLSETNTAVNISGAIVTAAYPDYFYIEADNRSNGIRVDKIAHGLAAESRANVVGSMQTNPDGERYIAATSVSPAGTGSVTPIAMTNKSIGGGNLGFDPTYGSGQQGIAGVYGVNNIGLLMRTCGQVTTNGNGYFYIDDGSRCSDASGTQGVKVLTNGFAPPAVGMYVQVTGISSCYSETTKIDRLIRTRTQDDVLVIRGAIIKGMISRTGGVVNTLIESPHPYASSISTTWTINGPSSATKMRVHFTQLTLEYNKDFLYLKKGIGAISYTYNLNTTLTDTWSPWVTTNVLKLNLVTSTFNNFYGFQVDKYESDAATGSGPVSGVTVTLNPGGIYATTAADGTYALAVSQPGTYTLTPSCSGMTFTPASKTVTVTDGQILSGVDFTVN